MMEEYIRETHQLDNTPEEGDEKPLAEVLWENKLHKHGQEESNTVTWDTAVEFVKGRETSHEICWV